MPRHVIEPSLLLACINEPSLLLIFSTNRRFTTLVRLRSVLLHSIDCERNLRPRSLLCNGRPQDLAARAACRYSFVPGRTRKAALVVRHTSALRDAPCRCPHRHATARRRRPVPFAIRSLASALARDYQ